MIKSKRLACVLLSILLVLGSLRFCPMRQVEAATTSISAESATEALMLLWNLMINAMVATGAGEMAVNYDYEKLTFESFMDTLTHDVMGAPDYEGLGSVILADGTYVDLNMLLSGTITLDPEAGKEETETEPETGEESSDNDYLDEDGYLDVGKLTVRDSYIKYRPRISPEEYMQLEGWSGSEPPDDFPEPSFSKIKQIILGSGVFTVLASTISKLWNGEIEGVDVSQYINIENSYTGTIPKNSDGLYYYSGYIRYKSKNLKVHQDVISLLAADNHYYCFFKNESTGYINLYRLGQATDGEYFLLSTPYTSTGTSGISFAQCLEFEININFPIFGSEETCLNYLKTGDDTGCLNMKTVDYSALAAKLPMIFSSITGKPLASSALQDMYARMKNAYQTQIKPQIETSTDTETNTETYTQVMTETVTKTETEPITGTEPAPTPTPTPTPEPETTPEEAPPDIADYKTDLRMIFPFCIPFDFIDLLQTLDAEPEAPCFEIPFVVPMLGIDERYEMDLSIFDDTMEIIRKLELIGFIITLMFITYKSIKW